LRFKIISQFDNNTQKGNYLFEGLPPQIYQNRYLDQLRMVDDGAIKSSLCLIMEVSNTGGWIMLIKHFTANTSTVAVKRIETGWWVRGALVLLGLALLWWFWQPVVDLLRVVGDREAVSTSLANFGLAGPLLLGLVLVLQVVVAAIPGHILMISGGYVYGFGTAFCLNLVSTVGGSQAAFLLARGAGRPVVERLAPADVLAKWNKMSAQKGLMFFLLAFVLPVFPADVMNYVAGLSALSSGRFFIANLFGRLPGVIVLTAIGAYGFELSGWVWLVVLAAAAVTFVAWRYGLARTQSVMATEALTMEAPPKDLVTFGAS
jgi:uncharacterized membrane protein YdjX (TVP38/TMEM64 family)